jgi:spermidine synthase
MKFPKSFSGFNTIHLIIFLSGFTFLIYEVVWNRMLSLVLGATVSAATIVLVSFMAGFGIGAFYWGRYANTFRKTAKLLSVLLLSIGFLSLLNYFMIRTGLPALYKLLGNSNLSNRAVEVIIFAISILLLIVPTFFMGGVLPVVSKIIIKSNRQISVDIGRIYAVETLGSSLGGLAAGFVFLGHVGQKNTILIAVAINLIVGLFLILSKKYSSLTFVTEQSGQEKKAISKNPGLLGIDKRFALISTLIFGFSILSLQIIWIRIFKIYLTNTSYTFALISSLVILGLFIGSWIFKKYAHKIENYKRAMLKALVLLALLTGLGLLVLVKMPETIMFPFRGLLSIPFIKLLVMPMVAALLVVIPPTTVSGFAFPLAIRIFSEDYGNISRSVGSILSANIIGSVMGPFVATFVLIPFIGVGISVLFIILLIFITSIYFSFQLGKTKHSKILNPALFVVSFVLLITIVFKPQIRIMPASFSKVEKEVLFYKETVEATLVVSKEQNSRSEVKTTFVNNAVVIGSTYDAIKAVKMIGHLPFFTGLECNDVLVVGFGIGVTTSTIASHSEVKTIDCVELAGGLKEAAPFYSDINKDIILDPRLNFIQGDGRHYLQLTSKKYDLISSDPTHPLLGSANLYSKEYFELCKSHLNPGGMVSQYLPLHKLMPEDFKGIIKTFHTVFDDATVWLGHSHAILIGSNKPIKIDFASWEKNIAKMGKDPVFYTNPYHLAASLMLDKEDIEEFPKGIKVNTDDLSYLEFFSPACFDKENLVRNISFLSVNRASVNRVFDNIDKPGEMQNFIEGSQYFIKSVAYFQNDKQKSLNELRKACRVNPQNQEYPFLIKFYYGVRE